jgi:hypothetical protein
MNAKCSQECFGIAEQISKEAQYCRRASVPPHSRRSRLIAHSIELSSAALDQRRDSGFGGRLPLSARKKPPFRWKDPSWGSPTEFPLHPIPPFANCCAHPSTRCGRRGNGTEENGSKQGSQHYSLRSDHKFEREADCPSSCDVPEPWWPGPCRPSTPAALNTRR